MEETRAMSIQMSMNATQAPQLDLGGPPATTSPEAIPEESQNMNDFN